MRIPPWVRGWRYNSVFPHLSIQQRLPLLICILLLSIVISFGWASYVKLKSTSLKLGSERLSDLTQQLTTTFQQAGEYLSVATRSSASQEAIVKYVTSGGKESRDEAMKVLEQVRLDTLSVLVEVLDSNRKRILSSKRDQVFISFNIDSSLQAAAKAPLFKTVGSIYATGDLMYFPVVAAITRDTNVIGYLVRWRWVSTSQKAIEQFSQLIGTNATIYIGNSDKKLWTDMIKPVPGPDPAADTVSSKGLMQYVNSKGNEVISSLRPVPGTNWMVMLEFSRGMVLEMADGFLYWIISLGTVLTGLGIFLAWLISRNITKPLHELTVAASTIGEGTYKYEMGIRRKDELGKLALAFKTMTAQIRASHYTLEQKVQDRTAKLEQANKELEAFSYSVSHDLRAPLRAVSGYSVMLKEDYEAVLDSEGRRIIAAIISNSRMMGKLIDDLIAFSKMGKKEVARHSVNMEGLVKDCWSELRELNERGQQRIDIDSPLPFSSGDSNMLKQVWMNLLSNAVKYSSRKEKPLIEIGGIEEADRTIYFVRDNGVGFNMDYAHKLFGVFQRLHSAEDFEGTGIGLALVQRIINKHGGEIWANSVPGEGASFFFSLPKEKPNGY